MKEIALSIDLESFIHRTTAITTDEGKRKQLDGGYIVAATRSILKLLSDYDQRITFFILGEIYNWYPELLSEIRESGHEIAWHGHSHARITNDQTLRSELQHSSSFISEFCPQGFRAPRLDLYAGALQVLAQHGFSYDSSVYGSQSPQLIDGVWEMPVTLKPYRQQGTELSFPSKLTLGLLAKGLPVGSGMFLGLLGQKAIQRDQSYVGILHPWQIFPPSTSPGAKLLQLIRNPLYLPYSTNCRQLFERLLGEYKLITMSEYLQSERHKLI